MIGQALAGLALGVLAWTATANAGVRRLVVSAREDVLGGDYKKLRGTG